MNHIDNIAIGSRVRELRKARGMTQEKLAEIVDCAPSYISVIESGKREMSLSLFVRIATALEAEPNDLMVDVIEIRDDDEDLFRGCSAAERIVFKKTLSAMREALREIIK